MGSLKPGAGAVGGTDEGKRGNRQNQNLLEYGGGCTSAGSRCGNQREAGVGLLTWCWRLRRQTEGGEVTQTL